MTRYHPPRVRADEVTLNVNVLHSYQRRHLDLDHPSWAGTQDGVPGCEVCTAYRIAYASWRSRARAREESRGGGVS